MEKINLWFKRINLKGESRMTQVHEGRAPRELF